MDQSAGNMHEKMKLLKQSYLEHLPEKMKEAWECFENCFQAGENQEALSSLQLILHNVKGSSATFGFPDIKSKALEAEEMIKQKVSLLLPVAEYLAELRDALAALELAITLHRESGTAERATHVYSPSGEAFTASEEKLIFIAADDEYMLEKMSAQLSQFGYQVRTFPRIEDLPAAVRKETPAAIIMDIMFPESNLAGIKVTNQIQREQKVSLPVIFISGRSDIDARLEAVRAGASAYFAKPTIISELIESLDRLTGHKDFEPYKILVIDDEPDIADYHAFILQNAGMKTNIVTNPLEVLEALSELNPDLILMDMYMPACNGAELAKVIRQTGTYFSIPIIFLSAETDLDKQVSAVNTGGDDFLMKPIRPDHLVSSVMARAERLRIIRSLMERDSLTGLLNHTKTKEQLDIAISRTNRRGGNTAFAMIDIDKFKQVNDTHGHAAGDKVLIILSRLLQQRLRKNDVIGRYGGEEFAVILNNVEPEDAERVLNNLRISFSKIKYQVEDKEFSVSFSCGFAMSSEYNTPGDISRAADKALYLAKHNGRNCVMQAPGQQPVVP